MLEMHIVEFDLAGHERYRILINRISVTRRITLKIKYAGERPDAQFECDGYELLQAVKSVL